MPEKNNLHGLGGKLWAAPQLVLAAPTQSWEWVPPCRSLGRRSQVRKTAQAFSASSDDFLRSILPTNRPRSRGDGRGALWAMYDLVPDSTFSFKRGGEKSSEKCASRPLCATTDSTRHASRCIVRSGVQRGGHPGPYGPIATISDPGPFPGKGKGLTTLPHRVLKPFGATRLSDFC